MSMSGKVALVTGAASGIGAASALAFGREGASVILADIDKAGGEQSARAVRELGVPAEFVYCSVADEESVRGLTREIADRFGRLDYAHNNAGIEQKRARIVDCTEDNWDSTVDTNLKGVWLSMKYEIPMLSEHGGAIVNTSSMVGQVGVPGAPAYVASKHGIIGLTRAAALEVASEGIRVNAVCPGHIRTAMVDRVLDREPAKEDEYVANTPLGRIATPDEVASAVVWLCSDGANFVTGHALNVDGGVVAK